jgi:hypothetical protein
MHGVPGGQTKREAILPQIITDRNLAAKGVPSPFHGKFSGNVRIGLDQDGDIQSGQPHGIGYSFFVSKIRERHQDSVDSLSMFPKKVCATLGVLPCFHAPKFGGLFIQDYRFNFQLTAKTQNVSSTFCDQAVGKEITVTHYYCQGTLRHDVHLLEPGQLSRKSFLLFAKFIE